MKYYVEVTESKKWIFQEIEADNPEAAADSALSQATGDPASTEKFVSHLRAI